MPASPDSVFGLVDEVRLQFHTLGRLADELHHDRGITAAMRAVLEYVQINGPTPVPRIAQARGVSRQHVQLIANDLVDAGLVTLQDNPSHRRSHLVTLTTAGERTIRAVQRRERAVLRPALAALDEHEVRAATDVLERLRRELDQLIDGQDPT